MKWLALLALLLWLCFAGAVWSHLAGNPTAINGVIGAGAMAVFTSVLTLMLRSGRV